MSRCLFICTGEVLCDLACFTIFVTRHNQCGKRKMSRSKICSNGEAAHSLPLQVAKPTDSERDEVQETSSAKERYGHARALVSHG